MENSTLVKVHNGYGWTSTIPNQITEALLQKAFDKQESVKRILDVGSGLGVATLPLLQTGAEVIALDIEASHLLVIQKEAESRALQHNLQTVLGAFPDSVDFEALDAIHCSNVLHFLPGTVIERGATKMYEWLRPGGWVYLQVGTIYAGHIKRFLPLFEERRQLGILWAGETIAAKSFVAEQFADDTPEFMNYLDEKPLTQAFRNAGFEIHSSFYYTRHGLPDALRSDGREHFGLVARKRC